MLLEEDVPKAFIKLHPMDQNITASKVNIKGFSIPCKTEQHPLILLKVRCGTILVQVFINITKHFLSHTCIPNLIRIGDVEHFQKHIAMS